MTTNEKGISQVSRFSEIVAVVSHESRFQLTPKTGNQLVNDLYFRFVFSSETDMGTISN